MEPQPVTQRFLGMESTEPQPAIPPKVSKDTPAATDAPCKPATSDEQRLEEGLEETFPASDPVSAKHID